MIYYNRIIVLLFSITIGITSSVNAQWHCGDSITDSKDGLKYSTVIIGNQCWMAQSYRGGTQITGSQSPSNNQAIEKYCYNDDAKNCELFGALYTWDEAMAYVKNEKAQGICPDGWHIPSDNEVKEMEIALGMNASTTEILNDWRGSNQGTQLKSGGSSGFEALYSGLRTSYASFSAGGSYMYFYTSTEFGNNAYRRCLRTNDETVGRWNTFPKSYAMSVRCLANNPVNKILTSSTSTFNPVYNSNNKTISINTPNNDQNLQIEIYSLQGNSMLNKSVTVDEAISVEHFVNGIYIIKIKNNQNKLTTQLISIY